MTTQIEKVESLIDAWKQGDIDGVLELVHDDVEYHYVVGARPRKSMQLAAPAAIAPRRIMACAIELPERISNRSRPVTF